MRRSWAAKLSSCSCQPFRSAAPMSHDGHEAATWASRKGFNGDAMPPVFPRLSDSQRMARLGSRQHGHPQLWHRIPEFVDIETRAKAELTWPALACEYRPDDLAKLAPTALDCLNPDGDFQPTWIEPGAAPEHRYAGHRRHEPDQPAILTPRARATTTRSSRKWPRPHVQPRRFESLVSAAPRHRPPSREPSSRASATTTPSAWPPRPAGLRHPRSTQRTTGLPSSSPRLCKNSKLALAKR